MPQGNAVRLSFSQIEAVWIQAGGSKTLAPLMAAIAMAESGGNPYAHNGNAGTGDNSYGLWQINYFGNLLGDRTARYGPPQSMFNPLQNAKAAVSLAAGGRGLGNWSTFKSGAYNQYLQAAQQAKPSQGWFSKVWHGFNRDPKIFNPGNGPKNFIEHPGRTIQHDVTSPIEKAGQWIGKEILYTGVLLGGAALGIVGFILIAADIGLAKSRTSPARVGLGAVGTITPGARRERREARQSAEGEAELARIEREARRARAEGAAAREAEKTKQQKARTSKIRAEAARARKRNKPIGGKIPY